jgi:hypothetical protein
MDTPRIELTAPRNAYSVVIPQLPSSSLAGTPEDIFKIRRL